jgi:hypothetical protein
MIQYNIVVDKLIESESDLSEVKHARHARIAAKNTTRWTGHSNAIYAITASWGAGQQMAKLDKYKNSVINDKNEGFTDFNHGLHAFLKDHYAVYWDKMVKRMQTTKKTISHEFSKLVRDWITAIDSYTMVNLFSTSYIDSAFLLFLSYCTSSTRYCSDFCMYTTTIITSLAGKPYMGVSLLRMD